MKETETYEREYRCRYARVSHARRILGGNVPVPKQFQDRVLDDEVGIHPSLMDIEMAEDSSSGLRSE